MNMCSSEKDATSQIHTPTPTATSSGTLIFADGFESGDFSAWDSSTTDGGDLSVTTGAAMVGAYGMQAVIDDNNAIYVTDETPNGETEYSVRFYFNPNSISMANNDNHTIFYAYEGASQPALRVELLLDYPSLRLFWFSRESYEPGIVKYDEWQSCPYLLR